MRFVHPDTAKLRALLEVKFPQPVYALAYEVRSSVGFGKIRTADALAFANWESRGCSLQGFEIKISVADLRRELADPTKAEEIARFCNFWSLVAPIDVVKACEPQIPQSWGILVPRGEKLAYHRRGAYREKPEPWTPVFVASLIRAYSAAAVEHGDKSLSARATELNQKAEELTKREIACDRDGYQRFLDENEQLRARVRELEEQVVVLLAVKDRWHIGPKQLGAAIEALRDLHEKTYRINDWQRAATAASTLVEIFAAKPTT